MGRSCNEETKQYSLRNRNEIKSISWRNLLAPNRNHKKSQPKTNNSRQEILLSKPEPKELINSFKVNPKVSGVKYYGNKSPEHQMKNPHQQSQYENNNISLGRCQCKRNGVDDFDRGYNFGYGINHFGYYLDNIC